ncbi:MAG: deoxyguanosinetriphosphate triphosphohydrolase [candidate division WOR-3 bacterium]|nr:deoxyguanosinetriphosphate triphosphohydrolase [candidate division WOR-3 bacterium]
MLSGRKLELKEEKQLASYACFSSQSRGRKYDIPKSKHRTAFQRDKDRVLHSQAFRRLEYKTQVFVNHEADYYRTRLTHTLEVSSIARSMAKSLGVNQDLAEAIAFAHDIGHTPFGHAGEAALHEIMKDYGGFEHNSQGLRVVEYLERRYSGHPGLNLTYEVREGIIKHHTSYDNPDNEMLRDYEPDKNSSIEGQIVNIADEIAYNSHDLDDGLESGFINTDQLMSIPLFKEYYEKLKKNEDDEKMLRFAIVRELIGAQISDAVRSTLERIEKLGVESVDDVRVNDNIVDYSDEMRAKNTKLKQFLYEKLYSHYKVLKMQHKAERYMEALFDIYNEDIRQLPDSYLERIDTDGRERVLCDYIAGMTDRYAQDEYTRLFLPYERM